MTTSTNRWHRALAGGAVVFAMALASTGCAMWAPADDGKAPAKDEINRRDRWDWRNNPDRFGGTMVTQLSQLPSDGRSEREVWPSTYWATYQDSIQYRWNGESELSAAEKYDRAFNGWTPSSTFADLRPYNRSRCPGRQWDAEYYTALGPLARYISDNMGNRHARDGVDSDNDGDIDECDDNDGVQTWFGLDHAWAAAALLEDQPLRSVTYNGITFHTGDMEALITAAYNRAGGDMIGGRCNDGSEASSPVERDAHGRALDVECRDTNPGSMHVILTNFLGIERRPFAEDRTMNYEVWNQPVVAYNVTQQEEITVERANELLGLTGNTYTYNADAAKLYDVKVTVTYITESYASTTPADPSRFERNDYYSYVLEVDANGDIIGGEWYGASRHTHPDFLWSPRRVTRSSVPYLDLENVRMLIALSREPAAPTPGDGSSEATPNLPIPDNHPAGVTSSLNVTDSGAIATLQLELDITHTYIGDLKVTLSHNGVERVVHNNAGGGADDLQTIITVAGFEGVDMNGAWSLRVVDSAGLDTGTLNRWALVFTTDTGPGGGGGGGDPLSPVSYSGQGNIDIPDNDPNGINATAQVPSTVTTGTVSIELDITHTYIGDLEIAISHGNTIHLIHNRTGGSADNLSTIIDLPSFTGSPAGTWSLQVNDLAGQDVGTLNSWAIRVTPDGNSGGGGNTSDPTLYPGQGSIDIPDNNATGITSQAPVPSTVTAGTVSIEVNITHTYISDLRVWVEHGANSFTLHDRVGGSSDNLDQVFDLPSFTGSPAGTWVLHITDDAKADVGRLESWSVIVTP